jgi:hypothetical protein
MKNWITKQDIINYIKAEKPTFWKFKIGDEVIYRHSWGTVMKGTIEELSIHDISWNLKPAYRIRYGKKEHDRDFVSETDVGNWISTDKAVFKQYTQIMEQLEQNKQQRLKLYDELEKVGYSFKKE